MEAGRAEREGQGRRRASASGGGSGRPPWPRAARRARRWGGTRSLVTGQTGNRSLARRWGGRIEGPGAWPPDGEGPGARMLLRAPLLRLGPRRAAAAAPSRHRCFTFGPPSSSPRAAPCLPSRPSPPLRAKQIPCNEQNQIRRRRGRISADQGANRAANQGGRVRIRRAGRARGEPFREFSLPSDSRHANQIFFFGSAWGLHAVWGSYG